jgi:hypothetical protein
MEEKKIWDIQINDENAVWRDPSEDNINVFKYGKCMLWYGK